MSTTTETFDTSCSDLLGFQCSTCLSSYANEVEYKLHYKSEFHKYNILRKMVSLPIVSRQQFDKHQQVIKTQLARPVIEETKSHYCSTCNKKFTNAATLKQHLRTKRHLQAESENNLAAEINQMNIQEGAFKKPIVFRKDSGSTAPDRGNPLEDDRACLFCNIISPTFEENLLHMERKHGFFIIDRECCKDPKKLFKYLADKIFNKKMCLFYDYEKCGKFKSGQAVQLHMIDRGHCMMNQEQAEEYDRFYDFTAENEAAYARLQGVYKDLKGGVEVDFTVEKKAGKKQAGAESEIKEAKSEDEEWEDEESENDDASETEVTEGGDAKATEEGKANQKRIFKLRRAKMLDTGELQLPSGRIAGHKDFLRYYKQRPHVDPQVQLRRLSNGRGVYTGKHTYGEAMALKDGAGKSGKLMTSDYNRYLAKIKKTTDKRLRNVYRKRDLLWMKLGLTGNMTYQKYFRDSTMVFG